MYTVHIVSWVEYYEYSTLTIVEDNFYKAMRHYRDAVKDKDVVRVTLETPTNTRVAQRLQNGYVEEFIVPKPEWAR